MQLNGGSGDDELAGVGADVRVTGGEGADQFAIGGSPNRTSEDPDTFVIIEDFEDGQDTLLLGQTTEFDGSDNSVVVSTLRFTDLTITQQGDDAVVSVGDDTLAVLNDVQASQLTAEDFVEADDDSVTIGVDADESTDTPVDESPAEPNPEPDDEAPDAPVDETPSEPVSDSDNEPEPDDADEDVPMDETPSEPVSDTDDADEDSSTLQPVEDREDAVLTGSDGPDDSVITGDGNTINAGGGNDDIVVTGDRTTLNGDDGNDDLVVTGDDSTINGGNGDDDLVITGDNVQLNGGSGDDELAGVGANVSLTGGDGADQFAIGGSPDRTSEDPDTFVTIEDFEDGQDTLLLGQTTEFDSSDGSADVSTLQFTDLTITQQGDDAVISVGDDTLAVLNDVQASQLTAEDFVEADEGSIIIDDSESPDDSGDENGSQDGDSEEPEVTSSISRSTTDGQIVDFLDYEQYIQLQDPDAEAPTDEVGGIPLAQIYDEDFYLSENADVAAAVDSGELTSGYDHFTEFGLSEGRDPSVLYDESFYLENNSDVEQAVEEGELSSGLDHFLSTGHTEGRDPSENFDESDYLLNNSDVAAAVDSGAFGSGFEHYVEFGIDEGRGSDLSAFDESVYLQNNTDVADAVSMGVFDSGFDHFAQFGQFEDRTFNNLSTIEIDQSVLG